MPGALRDWILPPREGRAFRLSCWTVYVFFFWRKKPYMSTNLANHSNTSRQIQETSRSVGYTARPAPGEAASPWQAI